MKPDHVHRVLEAVVARVLVVEAAGHRPRAVLLAHDAGEALGQPPAVREPLLDHLVADAPQRPPTGDCGRAAPARAGPSRASRRTRARSRSRRRRARSRPSRRPALAAPPGVERLVHDQHAQAVGGLQQLGRGRVVAGADGVGAHLLQDLELALERARVHGRAQRAEVVVVADALDGDPPAVEQEARVGVERDGADAEGRLDLVHDGAARSASVVTAA